MNNLAYYRYNFYLFLNEKLPTLDFNLTGIKIRNNIMTKKFKYLFELIFNTIWYHNGAQMLLKM